MSWWDEQTWWLAPGTGEPGVESAQEAASEDDDGERDAEDEAGDEGDRACVGGGMRFAADTLGASAMSFAAVSSVDGEALMLAAAGAVEPLLVLVEFAHSL